MSGTSPSNGMMDLEAFEALLDVHGFDARTWPDDLRARVEKLLIMSPEARELLSQDTVLRAELDHLPLVHAPGDLKARILTAFNRDPEMSLLEMLWPFGPIWRPVVGLVAVAAFGIYLGMGPLNPAVPQAEANLALGVEIVILGQSDGENMGEIAFAEIEGNE